MLERAIKYFNAGRFGDAIPILAKLKPSKEKYLNLAACYMHINQYSLARDMLEKVSTAKFMNGQDGFMVEACLNSGLLEYHLENDSDAIFIYRSGLEETKNYDLMWNYGITRLRQYCSGKYADLKFAWQLYEARFRIFHAVKTPLVPNWTGGVRVPSITVMAEQGIGDNIMFSRYLPEVAKWCDRLVVQCTPDTACLFPGYEHSYSTEQTTTHVISMCSLGNLLEYIPPVVPIGEYAIPNSGKIGLVWRSNNKHSTGEIRNIPVKYLYRLLELRDCYTLGSDCRDKRIPVLPSSSWSMTMSSLMELDAVVCIDTAIAHLCGTMGIPCYLLLGSRNTDWRWGDKSMGFNNMWYPSVKVIRNTGDWRDSVEKVIECLK